MSQFSRFQYKLRDNLVLLNYTKSLQKYSFLESQVDKLYDRNNWGVNSSVGKFSQKFMKYQSVLLSIQKHDFSEIDLRGIINHSTNNQVQSSLIQHNQKSEWTRLSPVLEELSLQYQQMQNSIYHKLCKYNLRESILALTNYNCMDIKIWQKVISFVAVHYKESTLEDRLLFITSISEYMKKFQFSSSGNKRHAFKFMYPETYLVDLIQFRSFFKAIQNQNDFISQNDSFQEEQAKLNLFQNIVYLIMKATKKNDMNIYSVRSFFMKRTAEMVLIASRHKKTQLHKNQLYHIYFIYSYLNIDKPEWFDQIEKYYFESFKETMMVNGLQKNSSELVTKKSKQMNKLLSIWKLNGRSNLQVYESSIRPFIIFLLKYDLQLNYFSNICLNLVTAGIKDYQTVIEMVNKCDEKSLKEDELLHMLKHYLNIVSGKRHYQSDYPSCTSIQNPIIINYLKDRQMKIFSCCLDLKQVSAQKQQRSYEYHKVEKFWFSIVKKIFEPKYQVIENAIFCNYQIDFLVLTSKFLLAIQVQGGHYNKKQFNKGVPEGKSGEANSNGQIATTGKKQMRQTVLKAYGIKIVRIHCEEKISTYYMQSRNVQLCAKFLLQTIHTQTGLSVHDF